MATQEEWKEYFQMMNEREPTLAEFEAALKTGEIENKSLSATEKPSGSTREAVSADKSGSLAPKRKMKKWIWGISGAVVAVMVAAGSVYSVNNQKAQQINTANIVQYLKLNGYKDISKSLEGNNTQSAFIAYDENKNMQSSLAVSPGHEYAKPESAISASSEKAQTRFYIFQTMRNCDANSLIKEMSGGAASSNNLSLISGNWVIFKYNTSTTYKASILTSLSQIPSAK